MFLAAILLLVVVALGLVVISPLGLRLLDGDRQVDWDRLSSIGQTYGAVSAIIAGAALLGVTVSLVIQGREAKAARKNARRAHHVELMRLAMDDPLYMECWGPYLTESFRAEGQYTYVNLIVAHWFSEYEVGELPDTLLRATAASVFAGGRGGTTGRTPDRSGGTTTQVGAPGGFTRCWTRHIGRRSRSRRRVCPPPLSPSRSRNPTWPVVARA